MTALPPPKAIWAEQKQEVTDPSPYGCLDCPPDTQHAQIYLLAGDSLCYTHAQIRRGTQIDHQFDS